MRLVFCLSALLVACGPSGGNEENDGVDGGAAGADANQEELATVMGVVWAPGNGPGMVPDGQEIPVYGAAVYVTSQRPAPIEQEAACMRCNDAPPSAVYSNHDGTFVLPNVVPGTYWLVIEKGQFRLETEITVEPRAVLSLDAGRTTMPSVHDPDSGKWIPRIAMASGIFDDMEDILGKMGIGEVDESGAFVGASAAGAFDLYSNGGAQDSYAIGTLGDLVSDLDRMLDYHIIFIPCSGSQHTSLLLDQNVLRNLRDYVAAGGKLYVTDWSGEWADNVFPAQVQLGSDVDTPAEAYDPESNTWNTNLFGSANGGPAYRSDDAEAADEDLRLWLGGQSGPYADGDQGPFDAMQMVVEGSYNHIEGLHAVEVGVDEDGTPVMDMPLSYVIGSDGFGATSKKPLTVTYEPAGCGRVLFSTYHTTANTHVGLVPQERVLVYLIMEIGVCKSGPIVD